MTDSSLAQMLEALSSAVTGKEESRHDDEEDDDGKPFADPPEDDDDKDDDKELKPDKNKAKAERKKKMNDTFAVTKKENTPSEGEKETHV